MTPFRQVRSAGWVLLGVVAAGTVAAPGTHTAAAPGDDPLHLAQCLPSGILAAYVTVGPERPGSTTNAQQASATTPSVSPLSLLEQAQAMGLFGVVDVCTREWLDSITAISLLYQYPHAVALFDISATPRDDGGHKLAGLSAAIVIETGGDTNAINRRVQHLLDTYTNAEQSILTKEKLGDQIWMTLRDRRLPEWVVIRWTIIGDRYIIAIGSDALHRVIATLDGEASSLATDDWFRTAAQTLDVSSASFWLFVRLDELRRSVDRKLARKVGDVLSAVRLGDVSRGLWTTRRSGRALEVGAYIRRGLTDDHERIADRRFKSRLRGAVIPDEATRYTIIDCHPVRVVRGIARAYLASRSPTAAEKSRVYWRNLQATSGIDIERDILKRLGHTVVIHDDPPHPLNLPFARTILIRVDREPDGLRKKVDDLLTYVRDVLIPPGLFQLRHTDDNVWHVMYGLNGPALTVLDRWVVIGFTPAAVREVRKQLQPKQTERL